MAVLLGMAGLLITYGLPHTNLRIAASGGRSPVRIKRFQVPFIQQFGGNLIEKP
jgi:hypothetical protein